MVKSIRCLAILLGLLPFFYACSDDDGDNFSGSNIQMYGNKFNIGSGVIWKSSPHVLVSTVPYVYKDTYTNDNGEEVTDEVQGFTASDDRKEVGNFTLSLYENGLTLNRELAAVQGKGACICFQLNSSDAEQLTEGKYVYGNLNEPGTFTAYASSEYDTQKAVKPAAIDTGTVEIHKEGDNYHVSFNVKTTFGGIINGSYTGPLQNMDVPQVSSAEYTNISLAGLLKETYLEMLLNLGTGDLISYGKEFGFDIGDPDQGTGYSFFSLTSGFTQYASSRSNKELVDIALYWDEENHLFRFESPIVMRSFLGHDDAYNFPCHTRYMKAPSTFTDEKFNNLTAEDFSFNITDEKVTIPVTTPEAFQPSYVFFETGRGVQGVIKIKQYTAGYERTLDTGGVVVYKYPMEPTLLLDIKCPAVVSNPQIR